MQDRSCLQEKQREEQSRKQAEAEAAAAGAAAEAAEESDDMGWDELDVDQIKLPGQEEAAPAESEEEEEEEEEKDEILPDPVPQQKPAEVASQQKDATAEKKVHSYP